MPRSDTRRDYRSFPREFFSLIERFQKEPKVPITIGPMPLREARIYRRELHRWKMFLANASDDDAYASGLLATWNELEMKIQPWPGEPPAGEADQMQRLIIQPSPLIAALRAVVAGE